MKTIKFFILISVVAIATAASAIEKPKMNVIPYENDKTIVALSNEKPALFEFSIHNEGGELIYFKRTKEEAPDYRKIYDLSNLEDGNYFFSVKVNDTKMKKEVRIAGKNITVGESQISYDPYFTFSEGQLKLSYLNFSQEPLGLNLYSNGELVYKSDLGRGFAINAGYDLSRLGKGKYDVVLTGDDDIYTYSIEK